MHDMTQYRIWFSVDVAQYILFSVRMAQHRIWLSTGYGSVQEWFSAGCGTVWLSVRYGSVQDVAQSRIWLSAGYGSVQNMAQCRIWLSVDMAHW